MPVYEYCCIECGPFEAIKSMSLCNDPCNCPHCGASAPRVMLTAPNVSFVSSSLRKGHTINERSADSPKKTSTHGPGCGCCSGGNRRNSKTLHRPDGSKSFPSKRPWMISH
ncbi:putative FmdB family regulatory protein [Yoonia maricola]|uniref:Putative FmdB family regulatory protein n=1 Tax=Yoonia maricola TaxID=420999 RepID=A0A2M8WNY2_9RHOB|nr:zinc ribbon domain-containing protein [Yoonia maricola]PJI92639.1 putative FmdB family regulatory protein [Yoonia maricola]